MAFPTFINSATTANATAATSQPLTMPGSIVSGRLLVAYTLTGASPSVSGWTQIFTVAATLTLSAFGKVAAGGDTGTVSTPGTSTISAVVAQYDTWSGSVGDIVAATNASNTDPPNDNPGVSKDWLWVPVFGTLIGSGGVVTAAPTNYADLVTSRTTTGITVAIADRALTASSEDPGTFTTSGGSFTFPLSATIAIAPAVAAAVLPTPQPLSRAALVRSYHY